MRKTWKREKERFYLLANKKIHRNSGMSSHTKKSTGIAFITTNLSEFEWCQNSSPSTRIETQHPLKAVQLTFWVKNAYAPLKFNNKNYTNHCDESNVIDSELFRTHINHAHDIAFNSVQGYLLAPNIRVYIALGLRYLDVVVQMSFCVCVYD